MYWRLSVCAYTIEVIIQNILLATRATDFCDRRAPRV